MGLVGNAFSGAKALKAAHSGVIFTSGRRGVLEQSRAMSQNVVRNRQWIARTYMPTAESGALQSWVNAHPGANQAQIATGFAGIMGSWTDEQKGRLSKHFSGHAFDVQPMVNGAEARAVVAFIQRLPGLSKFLDREGGLIRWHAQFN